MKAEMPSSVRAASATMPARSPLVTHTLVPLTTYSSPSRAARHEMLRVSLPASGSESDRRAAELAGGHRGSQRCFCSSVPWCHDQRGAHGVGVDDAGEAHPPVGQLLDDADVGEQVEAEAAVLLGDRDAEQAELPHLLDDRGGELVGVLELGGDRDDLAGDEAADGLDDLAGGRRDRWRRSGRRSASVMVRTSTFRLRVDVDLKNREECFRWQGP